MDNHNTFNPPVDAGADTSPAAEPMEPIATQEAPIAPEAGQQQVGSAPGEFGATSDQNGYGTDEKGYDIERGDLGPDFYNAQVQRGTEALYAAAEKEREDEEKAAFPDWYGDKEDIEKAQHELLSEALTTLREMRAFSEESQKKIDAEIAKAERIAAAMEATPQSTSSEQLAPEAAPTPPEADWTNPSVGAAAISDANAQNPAGARSGEIYVDSHGVSHSTREEAIAAEAGYR